MNVQDRMRNVSARGRLETPLPDIRWPAAPFTPPQLLRTQGHTPRPDNLTAATISAGSTVRSTVHTINPATNRLDNIANGPPGYN